MKLSEFINPAALKSGLQADNEALKTFVSEHGDIEMPDDIVNSINTYQTSLMTVDAAKANSELNNHFKATALGGIDEIVKGGLDGLKAEQQMAINNESNSYNKVKLWTQYLSTNGEEAVTNAGSNAVDTKPLTEKINELNNKISSQDQAWQAKVDANTSEWETKFKQTKVKTQFFGYDYGNGLDSEDGATLAENKLYKDLAANGWTLGDNLDPKTSDGADVFIDNKKVVFKDIADKAASGYLKKQDSVPAGASNPIKIEVDSKSSPFDIAVADQFNNM